ncbi:MAG: peptidylprolyl isomerase [Nitrospirae bacterium]|nr:peptidylprolyl isomerase [Nitrospirota bacterium]MBI3378447.1 peptidylprolyl isomerase [Nitrospirota bacterium]
MAKVKEGDTISIHYTGKLEDGTVFDSSEGGAPLEFKVGGGAFLKGLEDGAIGMGIGDEKTIRIPAEEGYGIYMKEKVFEFGRDRAPENFDSEIGQQLQMYRADGMPITVKVTGKTEKAFIMDCNHPWAGKNLVFEIKLVEIL